MDSHVADDFADTLQKHNVQKPVAIYSKNKKVCESMLNEYDVQSVLLNFSQQIKAFQNADKIGKGGSSRNNLDTYKTNNFLPINMISTEQQPEQIQSNKFETQCVLDTQLINIIESAEALIDVTKDMSEEFETTFNNVDTDNKQNTEEPDTIEKETHDMFSKDLETQENIDKISSLKKECDNSFYKVSFECNEKSERRKSISDFEVEKIIEAKILRDDNKVTTKSPIVNNMNSPNLKQKSPSPLVFKLESFEKFETIALSVIKDNPNFEAAKRIINSQIMNNEMFIQTHAEPVLSDRDKSLSPVLKISKPAAKTCNVKNISVEEDSILFSSDEEDAFKNDFEDLPLTCALETSFYKQYDVLDKTMFVGFQTASNKSIQVNSDSYTKAKSILENVKVPEEYISLTKLVEVIDNNSKLNNNANESHDIKNEAKFTDKEVNCPQNNVNVEIECIEEVNVPEIHTKSKRGLEEMLDCDDDQSLLNAYLEHEDFNICNNKKVKLSDDDLEISKRNTDSDTLSINKRSHNDKYHISHENAPLNEHLNIDELIMKEFENNFIAEDDCSTNTLKIDNSDILDKVHCNLQRNNDAVIKIDNFSPLGIKTANNKGIKISEQGLAKTKNIVEGIGLNDLGENSDLDKDYSTYIDQPSTSKNLMGFRTANNKEIKVSESALAKTKNIFDNIDNEDIFPLNRADNADKLVNLNEIKDDALKNKLNLVKGHKSGSFVKPFPSNRRKNDNLSTQTNSSKLFEKTLEQNNKEEVCKFIGFQTASNKTVKISKEALTKSKKLFSEIMSDENELCNEDDKFVRDANIINEFETSTIKTEQILIRTTATNEHNKDMCYPLNIGFQTASNKMVKVSNEALEKSKKLFQDIALSDSMKEESVESKCFTFQGFRAASNKPISISDDALVKTKNIFQDMGSLYDKDKNNLPTKDIYKSNKVTNPLIQGFKTASNKPVSISEDALAKSKNIFQDIDSLYEKNIKNCTNLTTGDTNNSNKVTNPVVQGFRTASNKPVTITDEALAKTKNIFQDIDSLFDKDHESNNNLVTKDSKTLIQGFKTASNKPVLISDEALAKTRNIFQDIDSLYDNDNENRKNLVTDGTCDSNEVTNPLPQGFKTASNKLITISDEALARSKKIYEDIEVCQQINNDVLPDLSEPAFQGFKTANNKMVNISKDALSKSKKLFQNLDVDVSNNENRNIDKENVFVGFQTASNKNVGISKEVLLKSKQIFEGIDLSQSNFGDNKQNSHTKDKVRLGFNTANNKSVNVSEESLKMSKKLLDKVVPDKVTYRKSTEVNTEPKDDYHLNIDELMNTEVIKNLEESLNTEDFSKVTSPISKRSGSPILSCPKAKKRKVFKTPQITNKSILSNNTETIPPTNMYVYNANYKKNKKYTLKDIKEIDSINTVSKVDPYILNFKFDTLLNFEFGGKRNDIDSGVWTTDNIRKFFIESVNKKIVPKGWIANHLKLIIWKLLSYEISFPNCMGSICTVNNVLHQLKYRYDRELYNVERPALRKILEKDEVASKLIVLCVADLYVNGECVSSVTNLTQNIELLLTDGWYCIKASTDRMIDKLILDGKIGVGTKLALYGAELMNCEQGIAPWEDISTIRLKISGNSTRRAKWDTKLGFHCNGAILAHLSTVKPEGGKISRLSVFVTRVYPMLYVEKFEDGSTVTRSERLEHIQQMKHEADRQNQIEKLYDELEKMAEQDSEGLDSDKGLDTGSQIYRHMKRNKDTSEFRVNLTESQTHRLQEHAMKKREVLAQKLETKIQDLVKKKGLDVARNVVPLLKMRVADVHKGCVSKAMITIWRPNECLLDLIKESAWLDVYNVVPTAVRFSEIQISAGRQSIFQPSKLNKDTKLKTYTETLKRKCYPIKDLHSTTDNEIDTIGLVFLIEPQTNQFQNIYLTDENKNIISINFWGGIKKFGFENIIDTGQVVACLNLQKRSGNTKNQIPQYRATEFTHFTRTCKIDFIRNMTDEFSKKFSFIDRKKFINDCVAIKNNFTNFRYGNTENINPYRLNNSDYNISKNKLFIDSPLNGNLDVNLNLSGLDFESTFKQTDTQTITPEQLLRKRKVNERIAKLKMYGEPPPLSSIHIINKSTIKGYKSPLIPKSDSDSTSNVASVNNLPQNVSHSSPVLNRTYVKSINPVKLKFCEEDGNTTDPFAEEFDCSPPLSLD